MGAGQRLDRDDHAAGARRRSRLAVAPGQRTGRVCQGPVRRQRAGIAWPGDAEEIAAAAAHLRDFDVAAKTWKRPIEGADQPGRAIVLARTRRAAPLI